MKTSTNKATIQRLKQQTALAQEEKAKALALFLSIGEGVIVTDQYGKIEQINKRALDILGFSEKEMIGKWFTKTIRAVKQDGSKVEGLDRPIVKAFMVGTHISEKMYYLTKKNVQIPVEVSVAPVRLDGIPVGAIEVFRDLSDEYTKEKVQSEFISIASHQLRTPLSSINTYAQMLTQGYAGELNENQAHFAHIIENSAKRMNQLIHTLLNVTRVEAGNINVNIQPVDMQIVCKEIINEQKSLALEKKVKITFKDEVVDEIKTDPLLVREVLSNLISNALKYTPQYGKVVLRIKFDKEKDHVIFSVKDNGYGIPKREQKHIFSKFFRANNVVKNDVSGTGLGLYLAQQIIDRLDGELWVSSKINKGSTFYFSLPMAGSSKKKGKFTLE